MILGVQKPCFCERKHVASGLVPDENFLRAEEIFQKFNFFLDSRFKRVYYIHRNIYQEKNHEGGLWFPQG